MGLDRPRIVQSRCTFAPVCRYVMKKEETQ